MVLRLRLRSTPESTTPWILPRPQGRLLVECLGALSGERHDRRQSWKPGSTGATCSAWQQPPASPMHSMAEVQGPPGMRPTSSTDSVAGPARSSKPPDSSEWRRTSDGGW